SRTVSPSHRRPACASSSERARRVTRHDAIVPSMSPVATIQRALAALLAAQAADGSFRDFALGIGASGPWVTAHVGARLASLPRRYRDECVAAAIAGVTRYLGEHRWSYNEHAPADADSIAHALIFLDAVGERRPEAARALTGYQL